MRLDEPLLPLSTCHVLMKKFALVIPGRLELMIQNSVVLISGLIQRCSQSKDSGICDYCMSLSVGGNFVGADGHTKSPRKVDIGRVVSTTTDATLCFCTVLYVRSCYLCNTCDSVCRFLVVKLHKTILSLLDILIEVQVQRGALNVLVGLLLHCCLESQFNILLLTVRMAGVRYGFSNGIDKNNGTRITSNDAVSPRCTHNIITDLKRGKSHFHIDIISAIRKFVLGLFATLRIWSRGWW
mmetsp:Transcript_9965/g.18979  ORF Transcript_9965/g.18979 Transcript_9965/m.18979 type:complete len:240 (-) Transcript_9965:3196-3915(-)